MLRLTGGFAVQNGYPAVLCSRPPRLPPRKLRAKALIRSRRISRVGAIVTASVPLQKGRHDKPNGSGIDRDTTTARSAFFAIPRRDAWAQRPVSHFRAIESCNPTDGCYGGWRFATPTRLACSFPMMPGAGMVFATARYKRGLIRCAAEPRALFERCPPNSPSMTCSDSRHAPPGGSRSGHERDAVEATHRYMTLQSEVTAWLRFL
jgi:hypothetical protein